MQHSSTDMKTSNIHTEKNLAQTHSLSSLAAHLIPTLDHTQLKEFRRQSFSKLENAKPISSKNEDFKYTNLSSHVASFKRLEHKKGIESVKKISSSSELCVIANGRYDTDLSQGTQNVLRVYEVSQELPEQFYEFERTKPVESERAPLALLSDVTFTQLIHVHVPKDSTFSIEFLHVQHGGDSYEGLAYTAPRILVTAEENARVNVIEHACAFDEAAYFNNHVIAFSLEEGAQVTHCIVQNENKKSVRASTVLCNQKGTSTFKTISLNFGSKITRNEVYPYIGAENSDAWLIGINVLTERQHVDNFTVIDHAVPNCESHELYKGLYADTSVGVFSGTIIVRPDAQKTNAYQSNSSILMHDTAESYSRPQLKIWADDVKCSHGATVGQVDEEALFYLMARGIPEKDAKIILTKAYVSEVFTHIEDDVLHSHLENMLEQKLSQTV